jgi:hypothetical protein
VEELEKKGGAQGGREGMLLGRSHGGRKRRGVKQGKNPILHTRRVGKHRRGRTVGGGGGGGGRMGEGGLTG